MNIHVKIKSSKGYVISQKINQFYLSKYVFKHNYLELKGHLEKQLAPELAFKLRHADHRDELHELQLETTRFLHNFIASAISLVDHTRVFRMDIFQNANDPFHTEYDAAIKENFTDNELTNFIKDFRQYFLHTKSPRISTINNLADAVKDIKASIVIDKVELLAFSGWKSTAKKYIEELSGPLDVLSTINDYYEWVIKFQGWFEKRQTEIFHTELKELNKLTTEAIHEDLKTIVGQFVNTDMIDNDFFLSNMTRYFDADQKKFYEKANHTGKVNFLIAALQLKKFITTPQEERVIREKLAY